MANKTLTMLAVGDLILDEPQAESYFTYVAPLLKSADVVVGQVEVVFTDRGFCSSTDVAAPPCDPANMSAIPFAGFNVITLAGNHVWDSGPPGIEDTIAGLQNYGIAVVGAGMNIDEARRPAIVKRNGTTFGFLSYNCVGPRESWATSKKSGCAYVNILTHYELDHATPGGPPSIYTFAEPRSLALMVDDIRKLRPLCDVLVVALHKGLGHIPAKLAQYEKGVSYAAIDAGADLILGHHAHILKGIEQYKGKTIFHGLCNFVTVTRALTPDPTQDSQQWAMRRKELFGFAPDPECPTYPFHPEAKQTIIAKCTISGGKITRTSYLPCLVNKKGQPEILKNDQMGQQVFNYVDKISQAAGLNTQFEWDENEVVVHNARY
jgi:poly-gamma-glutamate capsule biosynthesis protein CapA/YwtB (metallophosphatase superfamily)